MKIDITRALEALKASASVGDRFISVKIELQQHCDGEPSLQWALYGYSKDGKKSAWSSEKPSFNEALKSLTEQLISEETFITE